MIRIQRGPEPAELASIRVREVARVRSLRRTRALKSKDFGKLYTAVKRELAEAQRRKCCYCEWILQLEYNDLEHHRPKTRADRGPGFPDEGYWWLAWTWENLFFACPGCNRGEAKNEAFPLAAGSIVLTPMQLPPGGEIALLIDPAREDPMDHIQFKPVRRAGGEERWIPLGRTRKGLKSIEVYRLDRGTLVDEYSRHVREEVNPRVHEIEAAMREGDRGKVSEAWAYATKRLLRPAKPFAALAHDALDLKIEPIRRAAWGLELPRP